jgi:hypothetical protein
MRRKALMSREPVFISGVSSEFENVRELIKVCIHGLRSGTGPPASAAAKYAGILPDGFKEASYTQWEFYFARYLHKEIYLFRAGPQYVPERSDGEDLPGLQQKFVAYVDKTGKYNPTFVSADDLRRMVLLADWSKVLPGARKPWSRVAIVIAVFLFMNFVSAICGAPTVLTFLATDIVSKPSGKSDTEFFLSEHSGRTLFMAKTAKGLRIDFPRALDLGANNCIPPEARASSVDSPDLCQYNDTTKEFSISADGSSWKKRPGFWLFNLRELGSFYSFMRTTRDGKSDGPKWFVKFREAGEPCIGLDARTKCFPLGAYEEDEDDTPKQRELRRQIYFDQLQLESRYDLITEKLKMLIVAFALGFSALVAAMAQEVTGFADPFAALLGKGLSFLGKVLRRFGLRRTRSPAI